MKLYDFELSGNCYKVRLMLGFLGLSFETVPVDFHPGREHLSDWFLELNPFGELPVLDDDGIILRDSQAILVYLARKYDAGGHWYPVDDPERLAQIEAWHDIANRITATASTARLATGFHDTGAPEAVRAGAHRLFRILDEHLWFAEQQEQSWLCPGDHPTTADIACFPYVALSGEGDVSLQDYPALRRWLDRIRRIAGFRTMSGVFPTSPAR